MLRSRSSLAARAISFAVRAISFAARSISFAVLALCVAALFAAPLVSHADDGASKKKAAKHLDYRKTYEDALLEARIRNLPVFISRHKDF